MSYHLVAANLVERDGEYLLVQEGKEEVKGLWNFPSGGIERGEDPVTAAARECLEETGLEVEVSTLNGLYFDESDRADIDVEIICFNSNYISGSIDYPESEIMDAQFFSKDEIEDLELRVPYVEEAIERYENDRAATVDLIKGYR